MAENRCESYDADLVAYFQGELTPDRRGEVDRHLADCAACASALREVAGVFSVAATVEDLAPSLRLKRNVASLARRARRPAPERLSLGDSVRAAAAYLGHRIRTSRRFRLTTISVAAHVVLLLVVSLVVIPRVVEERHGTIRPGIDSPLPMHPEPAWPDVARSAPMATPPEGGDVSPVVVDHDPFGGPSADPDLPDVTPYLPPVERPVIQPLAGLFATTIEPDVKARRLAACLRDPEVALESVERALGWLAGQQLEDGSFPVSARGGDYGTGVTAAALLAFASDGHSETRGASKYREVVGRAVDRLLADQHEDGELRGLIGPAKGHFAYNHALATTALVEIYVLDYRRVTAARTLAVKRALRLAVDHIIRTQLESGAWPYGGGSDARQADTSVAIYMGMALAAAKSARIPVPDDVLAGLSTWIRSVTGPNGRVGYLAPGDREKAACTLTAGVLNLEEHFGIAAPVRDRQAALVLAEAGDPNRTKRNSLLRFYASLAFRARGAPVVDRFVPEMIATQRPDGSYDANDDEWAVYGGDVFLTALNVLTVTSCFRLVG